MRKGEKAILKAEMETLHLSPFHSNVKNEKAERGAYFCDTPFNCGFKEH